MRPYTLADAESDLVAALEDDDQDRIAAAGRLVDRLDPAQQPGVMRRTRIVLDTALGYAELGIHVFPLDGKTPRVKWREQSTTDTATITSWWRSKWPEAGIGIDCDKSGLVVVDLDVKDGVDGVAGWKELTDGKAPATFYAATPSGGWHLYYRDPEGRYRNSASQVAPGVDVRGVGGYVVAPGSSGYRWHAEAPLTLDDIPVLPDGIIPISLSDNGTRSHWTPLDRAALDPRDLKALGALEWLGGHSPYLSDGYVKVCRPGKTAGSSASIGYAGPGLVKIFTPHWSPLTDGGVYDADELVELTKGASVAATRQVRLIDAATINVRPVTWLWQDRLAVGTVALLAGREGIGKSTVAYQLAGDLTQGTLKGIHFGRPRSVIIAATEDSWAHTIVPRLMAAGAELTLVHRVDVLTPTGDEAPLVVPLDLAGLAARVTDVNAALILFDPIISRLSDDLDTHRDAEVRRGLEPIGAMADRLGVVVLGIIHVTKSGTSDPLNAVMASKAFTSVARAVLFCMHDPDNDDGIRLLGQPKNNLGRDDLPTITFRIETAIPTVVDGEPVYTGRIQWLGEVEKTIREALEDDHDPAAKSAVGEAVMWLEDHLTQMGGTAKSADVKKGGRAAGHNERTLARARKKLRLDVNSTGFPRETWWSLRGTQPSRADFLQTVAADTTGVTEPPPTSRASGASGDSPRTRDPTETGERSCAVCGERMIVSEAGQTTHPTCEESGR